MAGGPQQGVGRLLLLLRFRCWLRGSRLLLGVGRQAEGRMGSFGGFRGTFELLLRSFGMLLNTGCSLFYVLRCGGVFGGRDLGFRLWVPCLPFLNLSRIEDGLWCVVGDNARFWEVRADHKEGLKAGAREVVLGCVARHIEEVD